MERANKMQEYNNDKRLCKIEERLASLEGDKKLQNFQYETILKALDEINLDIKTLKETPSKRWDIIVTSVLTGIVAFVITYITQGR